MLGQKPEGEVGSDRWLQHTEQVQPWPPGLCDATVPENAAGEASMGHFDCAAAGTGRVLSNMVMYWWEAYPREAACRDSGEGVREENTLLLRTDLLETFWLLKMRGDYRSPSFSLPTSALANHNLRSAPSCTLTH